jgi:quinol monooxygenase YgiN
MLPLSSSTPNESRTPQGAPMAQHITLMTLQIAPEKMVEFEAMMEVEAPLTRGFEGCELFEVCASTPTPGEVQFLEHWRSEADERKYSRWRTERGDMERLGAFFVAPPRTVVLRRMASD